LDLNSKKKAMERKLRTTLEVTDIVKVLDCGLHLNPGLYTDTMC